VAVAKVERRSDRPSIDPHVRRHSRWAISSSRVAVLIDATTAEHARGIRTVILGVLGELPHVTPERTIVAAGCSLPAVEGLPIRRVALAKSRPGRLLYQRLLLPFDASRLDSCGEAIDRVLLLDAYAPLVRGRLRYAALVHDVLPLTHPQFWPLAKRLVKRRAFSSLRRAGATLLTSTAHNASEIQRLLGVKPRVIRFGCGQLTDSEADAARTSRLPEREPYLVYVGAFEPRKDVLSLIEMFDLAVSRGADSALKLVGSGDLAYVAAVKARIAASPYSERIEVVTQPPRDVALRILRHATALIFPTLAEGFGLPILEALALGTPVVASDLDPIRSWAGDEVFYAQPSDPRGWPESIAAAAASGAVHRRSGQALAAGYRWRHCVEEMLTF